MRRLPCLPLQLFSVPIHDMLIVRREPHRGANVEIKMGSVRSRWRVRPARVSRGAKLPLLYQEPVRVTRARTCLPIILVRCYSRCSSLQTVRFSLWRPH